MEWKDENRREEMKDVTSVLNVGNWKVGNNLFGNYKRVENVKEHFY